MTERYVPELGQAVFGQPFLDLEIQEYVETGLDVIRGSFVLYISEDFQKDPFSNTGASYKNDVFEVQAYSWGDEEQPFNFRWKDFCVSWYKHFGRGTSQNREMSRDECKLMVRECVRSMIDEHSGDMNGR